MNVEVLEYDKNRIKLSIKDETHTFCNVLRKELWEDKGIKIVGYNIEHALVSSPIFTVESEKNVINALVSAAEGIKKKTEEIRGQLKAIK